MVRDEIGDKLQSAEVEWPQLELDLQMVQGEIDDRTGPRDLKLKRKEDLLKVSTNFLILSAFYYMHVVNKIFQIDFYSNS